MNPSSYTVIYVILWWLIVQFFGWLALPAAYRVFRWLPDRGYAFSKALGLLLVGYMLWLGAVTGFLHNSRGGMLVAILLVGALSAGLYWRYPRRRSGEDQSLLDFLREHKGMLFSVEALFTVAFVVWAVLRAYASFKIDTAGGEKFMEVAFLNSILRSVHFPPVDPWLSGFSISYYYFGYVMMAMMTRLSGAPVGIGFDLYDSMLFALTLVGAFGVVYNLIPAARRARSERPSFGSGQPIRYALLGALLVAVMGNLSGFFESVHSTGLITDSFWKWLDQPTLMQQGVKDGTLIPKDNGWFWWWRGSRVVFDRNLLGQSDPGNPNITEFPFFSFLLGDNHPHVLDLPFVLMAIGLALNLLRRQLSEKEDTKEDTPEAQEGLEHEATRNDAKDAKETLEHEATRNDAKDANESAKDAKEALEREIPLNDAKGANESAKDALEREIPRNDAKDAIETLDHEATRSTAKDTKEDADDVGMRRWWDPATACLDGDWVLFLFMAFALGALGFLNTWDFPIYLTLTALAYGVGLYATQAQRDRRRLNRQIIGRTLTLGIGLGLAGVLFYILFYLGFSSQASGILPYVFPPTELRQFFVMFGPFLVILTIFMAVFLARSIKQEGPQVLVKTLIAWLVTAVALLAAYALVLLGLSLLDLILHLTKNQALNSALSGLSASAALGKSLSWRLRDPWVLLLLSGLITLAAANVRWHVHAAGSVGAGLEGKASRQEQLSSEEEPGRENNKTRPDDSDERLDDRDERPDRRGHPPLSPSVLFVFLLVFLGVALTLVVEFVYLRDVFNTRMNTVFKFYFEGWVMMACASAYGIWWMINRGSKVVGQVVSLGFVLLSGVLVLAGLFYPVFAFVDRADGFKATAKPNLDGTSALQQRNPDDWAAIQWLDKNVSDTPTILEAPGGSYTYEGRISALTGLPAVLGWSAHEDQWRGSYVEQGKREPDIVLIYTSRDAQQTLDLLHKWNVSYVILGDTERNYIKNQCSILANACSANTAEHKFEGLLTPVFTGTTMIYAVP